MKKIFVLILIISSVLACDRVKDKTKEVINKGGETVGKGATEFIEGVSEGVDKTLKCEIILSERLKTKGLQTGKFSINNDSTSGKNNLLTLYLIFEKNFKETISIKAFDKNGLEIGRVKKAVFGKAGEAKYIDFCFDKRTYIEVKSKINIE
ncbi:MAG: hypothetical protein ACOYO1_08255 [Bacteroidales bacterium]